MQNKKLLNTIFESRFLHMQSPDRRRSSDVQAQTLSPQEQIAKAEKDFSKLTLQEQKFKVESLLNEYENADNQSVVWNKLLLLARMSKSKSELTPLFKLGSIEQVKKGFEKAGLLPSRGDKMDRFFSATDQKLRKLVSGQLLKSLQILRATNEKYYKKAAKNLLKYQEGQTDPMKAITASVQKAVDALKRHQSMRDLIKTKPELYRDYMDELNIYRNKNQARRHFGEEYQILKKYHEMAKNGETTVVASLTPSQKPQEDDLPQIEPIAPIDMNHFLKNELVPNDLTELNVQVLKEISDYCLAKYGMNNKAHNNLIHIKNEMVNRAISSGKKIDQAAINKAFEFRFQGDKSPASAFQQHLYPALIANYNKILAPTPQPAPKNIAAQKPTKKETSNKSPKVSPESLAKLTHQDLQKQVSAWLKNAKDPETRKKLKIAQETYFAKYDELGIQYDRQKLEGKFGLDSEYMFARMMDMTLPLIYEGYEEIAVDTEFANNLKSKPINLTALSKLTFREVQYTGHMLSQMYLDGIGGAEVIQKLGDVIKTYYEMTKNTSQAAKVNPGHYSAIGQDPKSTLKFFTSFIAPNRYPNYPDMAQINAISQPTKQDGNQKPNV